MSKKDITYGCTPLRIGGSDWMKHKNVVSEFQVICRV
jgi:hypothetical protein